MLTNTSNQPGKNATIARATAVILSLIVLLCCHLGQSCNADMTVMILRPPAPPPYPTRALTSSVVQVAQLRSRVQVAASRGAEELDELTRVYEERMAAMRSQLEQQEADKAALLDIVQVRHLRDTRLHPQQPTHQGFLETVRQLSSRKRMASGGHQR